MIIKGKIFKWTIVGLIALATLFLVTIEEFSFFKEHRDKVSFQDFGFEYFRNYESDVLVANYAIALKDSILYTYISLENGVAFNKQETTPEYGIANEKLITLDAYQLNEVTDSILTYVKIKGFELDGGEIKSKAIDTSKMDLKLIGDDKLIFGSNTQDEENSNLYEKKLRRVKISNSVKKLLIQSIN